MVGLYNLARVLRPQDFDTIIGQEIVVRMLKNTLYRGYFFPVYLFAGSRGCGKTTTARVFGAAINCHQLSSFQKQPKGTKIPCLQCSSCTAMRQGNHPDFIEIDAASHTGVDNVRALIESSPLLPLMGRKKIYLIDEAHMLTKAACNAFLKILEEPPATVLFMLATTDPQRIIETVRSRCFQLFFHALSSDTLVDYLMSVCAAEEVLVEREAMVFLVQESGNCVRDALNIVEQVRFATEGTIDKEMVMQVLGRMHDTHIVEILHIVCVTKKLEALADLLQKTRFEQQSAEYVWNRLILYVRAMIWQQYGQSASWQGITVPSVLHGISLDVLIYFLDQIYAYSEFFMKTTAQHAILEMVLMKMCLFDHHVPMLKNGANIPRDIKKNSTEKKEIVAEKNSVVPIKTQEAIIPSVDLAPVFIADSPWTLFVKAVSSVNDLLLISIFKQARFIAHDAEKNTVEIAFGKDLVFFKEWIDDTQAVWQPLFHAHFPVNTQLESLFTDVSGYVQAAAVPVPVKKNEPVVRKEPSPSGSPAQYEKRTYGARPSHNPVFRKTHVIDISDKEQWKNTHTVLHYFPGVIIEAK